MHTIDKIIKTFYVKTPYKRISDVKGDVDVYYREYVRPRATQRYHDRISLIHNRCQGLFGDDVSITTELLEVKEKVSHNDDFDFDSYDDSYDSHYGDNYEEYIQVTYSFKHKITLASKKDVNIVKMKYFSHFSTGSFNWDELTRSS